MSLDLSVLRRLGAKLSKRGPVVLGSNEPTPEDTRMSILVQIQRIGWAGEHPGVVRIDGQRRAFATGPLEVVGGCFVQFAFDGANDWRVMAYLTAGTYIVEVTGKDGKTYPAELRKLRNPTRRQLDAMLTSAGLTDGQLLIKEIDS